MGWPDILGTRLRFHGCDLKIDESLNSYIMHWPAATFPPGPGFSLALSSDTLHHDGGDLDPEVVEAR